MAPLTVESGGRRYVIGEAEMASVGRDPASTIPVVDDRVSRRHAVLHQVNGQWIFEDLASGNGSFAQGVRVAKMPIAGETSVRLANPSDGPVLSFATASSEVRTTPRVPRWAMVAIGTVIGLLILFALVPSLNRTPLTLSPTPTAVAPITRADAAAIGRLATVHIFQGNIEGTGTYLGGGRILTAAHVVANTGPVVVFFADQRVGNAQVLRIDKQDDLALLSLTGLDALGARALEWGDSDALRAGEDLIAMGYPEGLPFTVKVGVVSGLRTAGSTKLIQTDASLNHGMSGGPVIESNGRLVGITDFGFEAAVGLNFAIASSTAREFVEGRR